MGLNISCTDGQTPLEEDEIFGLRIPGISTRGELDEFEQLNIEKAIQWTLGRTFKPEVIFSADFVQKLHAKMFGDVWTWAGKFRKTNKNLGTDYWKITTELQQLLDDALYWYNHKVFQPDEISLRCKHRLVSIHCFSNGNGRHSRLMADVISENIFKNPVFTWGANNLTNYSQARSLYLTCLKSADKGDFRLLLDFARS